MYSSWLILRPTGILCRYSVRTKNICTGHSSRSRTSVCNPLGSRSSRSTRRAAGSPEAVRAWFYPGENFGHQFVYPKAKAVALAKANNTPVPSMPAELATNTKKPAATMNEPHVMAMKQAPLKAQMPTEEEVDIGEVFVAPASPVDQGQMPAELPEREPPSTDWSYWPPIAWSGPRSEICGQRSS